MTERGKLDTAHAVIGIVCIVAVTVTVIVSTIRNDRRSSKTFDELTAGARALRGNFDGHQCAPPACPPGLHDTDECGRYDPPPMPMQTEN